MAKEFLSGQTVLDTMVTGLKTRCTVKELCCYLLDLDGDLPIGSGTMETSNTENIMEKAFLRGPMVRSMKANGNKVDLMVTEATKAHLVENISEIGATEHSTELELVSIPMESCTLGSSRTTFDMEWEPANGQTAVATLGCGITMKCATRPT